MRLTDTLLRALCLVARSQKALLLVGMVCIRLSDKGVIEEDLLTLPEL